MKRIIIITLTMIFSLLLISSCGIKKELEQMEVVIKEDFPLIEETFSEDCSYKSGTTVDHSVEYYRVRIEFVTSSNWSKFNFSSSGHIIKFRTMSVTGDPDKGIASYDGITVNQSKTAADNGNKVTIIADYAFRPEAITTPVDVNFDQGSIGSITVKFYSVINNNLKLIKEVTNQKGASFNVDLSSFKDSPPNKAPLAHVRRMAWGLYYPWYTLKWWEKTNLKDIAQYPYDSGDSAAVLRQIQQAKSAGITGFISSWWGPGTKTDKNLATVLKVAGENNFKIGMFLETRSIIENQNNDMQLIENELVRWIEHYVNTYGGHLGTMKVDGKTFVMPWVTCTLPVSLWENVRRKLNEKNVQALMIADCQKEEYFDVFDGALGNKPELGRTLRYYAALADNPSPKIWMSSAMPGYDERLLEDRVNPRYYDRENGAYFRRELNTAFRANPQWVRMYTWNEYPENTYIEPSRNFGDKYLKIAGEYLLPWICSN